jgi:hypothetical protein
VNNTKPWVRNVGAAFCGAMAVVLAGCTTYQGSSQDGSAYGGSYAEIRTESDFYEPLSPYGRWEVVGSYGRCWIPGGVEAGWSPYSNGYWQQSDAGWYWASDEPWGWATYHYGRWDSSPQYGWYWVPQTQWAPAWVSWREGGGYVGWAPLSPSGRAFGEVNPRGAAPGGYVFVEERRFLEPVRPTAIIVDHTVINRTAINEGPGAAAIEKASGQKTPAVPVRQLRSKEEAKVVVRHPTPPPAPEKAGPPPDHRQAEKALPAPEPRQQQRPAVATPPPPGNEVNPADGQRRIAKPNGEPRPPQEAAQEKVIEQRKSNPAAVEARHEAPQEAKPEIKSEPPQATKPEVRSEVQHATKPVSKPEAQQQAKHEPQPEAKAEPKPAPNQHAAAREPTEHKPGKDVEKKDE